LSCDVPLGIPYNIASYALLLKLLAKEAGMKEGKLIGFLADTHIYLNQIDGVMKQISRTPLELCEVNITNTSGIFNWTYKDLEIINYKHLGKINFPLAV
jgi:thymidylate synthase